MGIKTAPGCSVAPKQAHIVIGIPAAAAPPALQEKHQARHGIAGISSRVTRQSVVDLAAQFRRDALIGIDKDHPILGRLRMSKGFLIAVSRPCPLDHPVRVAPANLQSSVRAKGVHDHDFVAPAQAFKACANVFFFVEANHDGGNSCSRNSAIVRARNAQLISAPTQTCAWSIRINCRGESIGRLA